MSFQGMELHQKPKKRKFTIVYDIHNEKLNKKYIGLCPICMVPVILKEIGYTIAKVYSFACCSSGKCKNQFITDIDKLVSKIEKIEIKEEEQ